MRLCGGGLVLRQSDNAGSLLNQPKTRRYCSVKARDFNFLDLPVDELHRISSPAWLGVSLAMGVNKIQHR